MSNAVWQACDTKRERILLLLVIGTFALACPCLVLSVFGLRLYCSSFLHHYDEGDCFHKATVFYGIIEKQIVVLKHFLFTSFTNIPLLSIIKRLRNKYAYEQKVITSLIRL